MMGGKSVPLGLLDLPDKAVTNLLEHLNLFNLMSMRLVCKKTKSWVEKPKIFQRFSVPVVDRPSLKKMWKSKTLWSNLDVMCDSDDLSGDFINAEHYLNALSKLKGSLRVVRFSDHRLSFNTSFSLVVRNCPNLTHFEMDTLDVSHAVVPVSPEILRGSKSLEKLCITYIGWRTEAELQVLPQLLQNLKNLKYLKVPYILSTNMFTLYPDLDEDAIADKLENISKEVILNPLMGILENSGQGSEQYSLKHLDVQYYDLDELLPYFRKASRNVNCLLQNVSETYDKPLEEEEVDLASKMVASLRLCTNYLPLHKLDNLRKLTLNGNSDIDKSFSSKQVPLPLLECVNLTLTESILQSERIASVLLQRKRKSVKKVSVSFGDLKGSAQISVFRPPKFAASLSHLTSLRLDGYDGKAEDYRLYWRSFPLLEHLELMNCTALCDKVFVEGEDEDSFISLRYLKRIMLDDENITDTTMTEAISKIPFEVLILNLPKVTTLGLASLMTEPLTSSLMMFHCLTPDDMAETDMKDYFKNFKNLKKFETLF